MSLSARRAWIEITDTLAGLHRKAVALRKESVDRNAMVLEVETSDWKVALRKESVDRNMR